MRCLQRLQLPGQLLGFGACSNGSLLLLLIKQANGLPPPSVCLSNCNVLMAVNRHNTKPSLLQVVLWKQSTLAVCKRLVHLINH